MFELLREYKSMHVMHLPQGTDRSDTRIWWVNELCLLKEQLERNFGVIISHADLWSAIKLCNRERLSFRALHELNRLNPAPLTGVGGRCLT